jgi:hypothetical protein
MVLRATKRGGRRAFQTNLGSNYGTFQIFSIAKTLTFNEEHMCSQILLSSIREITDNAIYVLRCGHEKVQSLELLRRAMSVD